LIVGDQVSLDRRLDALRARLAVNLGELQRRATHARELISPRTYLENRWVQLGLGLAAGYMLGRRRTPRLLTAGSASSAAPETLVHALLRSTVMTLATAAIRRAISATTTSD
jgi:hypothetical protein